MTFIDWSDHEEMLGLLVEYVADEKVEAADNRERAAFLARLAQQLRAVADHASSASVGHTLAMLRSVSESQPDAFESDAVLAHLHDCIEELERIRSQR